MLKTKEDYTRAFAVVGEVINSWDPYGLIETGAPPDEFDGEVGDMLCRLSDIRSPEDASLVISKVFSRWFFPDDFPQKSCVEPGQKLYSALRKEGFVQ